MTSEYRVGDLVKHDQFGHGRVVDRTGDLVAVQFGAEVRRISVSFPGLTQAGCDDADVARIKIALREVLGDFGWLDAETEMGRRWAGGTLRLIPGKDGTAPRDIPIEAFFKKIIGVRDKLRVLEMKLNSNPNLSPEEKLEMQGYITRSYGSLTTFNILFAERPSAFVGQSADQDG